MYFGNMGDASDKETVFYEGKQPIRLYITCFIKELRETIDENIVEFFMTTNFGTRQSKGFGGFSIINKGNEDPVNILNANHYCFFYCDADAKLYDEKLKIVQAVSAVMKGGINRSKRKDGSYDSNKYIKGYIQRQYLNDIGKRTIGSEKAYVKSKVKPAPLREKEKNEEYQEWEFVRALLGVPGSLLFRDPDHRREGEVKIMGENGVDRFKSPIIAKVVGNYVLFIVTDSYKLILGKKFAFGKENNTICVPNEFDPDQFVKGFTDYFNTYAKGKLENVGFKEAGQITLKRGANVCNTQE
jgi:hypothetical protein